MYRLCCSIARGCVRSNFKLLHFRDGVVPIQPASIEVSVNSGVKFTPAKNRMLSLSMFQPYCSLLTYVEGFLNYRKPIIAVTDSRPDDMTSATG
jgi:hypothetical protein